MNINQKGIPVNWDPKAMGQRIRFIRGKMSQVRFAEKLGISQVDVSRYEQGKRSPPLDILLGMAQVGNVSIDFLVRGTGPLSPSQVLEPALAYDRSTQTLWVGNLDKPDQALVRTLARRLSKSEESPSRS